MPVSLLKTKDTEVVLHMPLGGINVVSAFAKQPNVPIDESIGWYARTTPLAVNVRAYAADGMARGGSRSGLSRYIDKRLPGSVMGMGIVVTNDEGSVQSSTSGRLVTLVVVANGNVRIVAAGDDAYVTPTNGNGALIATGVVQSAANFGKLFFADGVHEKYYDPFDNTVHAWVATSGTLPTDSDGNKPRLISNWQGSIMLSGLPKDPQNWFKSATGSGFDWNYSPTSPSPLQAIAGNDGPYGIVGDVITALVPFSDDIHVFGGDHSISALQGNPADGGRMIKISDAIGMAWGSAWCKDPFGYLYFFSNTCGIYRIDPTAPRPQPVRISQQIDPLLATVNTGANTISMGWDDSAQGMHVFVTRTAGPYAGVHLFYEGRTNAWFAVKFANRMHNPLCCLTFDGNTPNDRKLLIGSWDGYVRYLNPAATDDDGTPIESKVLIGPLRTNNLDQIEAMDMLGEFGETGGKVSYEILVGKTAEQALASVAVRKGDFGPGRNHAKPVNKSGYAIYLSLAATSPWALESVRMTLRGLGPVLRKGA